ncbi:MAG: hypothetical protein AB1384_07410 [Actinomycetota bacterium]
MNGEKPGGGENEEQLRAEIARLKAEKAELQAKLDAPRASRERHFPWRGIVAWILVVLACFMAILSPIAVWARANFLDTEQFVETVGPLAGDETVAKALSDEISARLFTALEIQERIRDALNEFLPEQLDFIAGPIASGLQSLTNKITYEVLTSSQFEAVWYKILEVTHSTAVGIIRGDKAITLESNGEVVLDVGELVANVKDRLVEAGLTFLERVPIPQFSKEIVLFESDQLGMAKTGVEILDTLNWFLPLIALVLFAAAVLVSEDRRRFLMISSAALAVAMALSLMVLNLAKGELLGQVRNPANLDAATVIWNQLTTGLIKANTGLLVLGIVGAVGFAIAGPYAWALWLRDKTGYLFRLQRERRLEGKESGPVGIFFAAHIWGMRVAGAAVLFGILWLMRPLSGVKVIVVLGIYLIYLVICELLRGKLPEAEEEGPAEKAAPGDGPEGPSGEGSVDPGKEPEKEGAEEEEVTPGGGAAEQTEDG